MQHKTFEEFKTWWRNEEATKGTKQEYKLTCACGKHIVSTQPATDEELLEMWNIITEEESTGLKYHGTIIGGDVLTLKDLGQ